MSDLFKIRAEIPEHQPEIPAFQTTSVKSFSRRNEKMMAAVHRRSRRYARHFGIEGEHQDLGDRLVYLNETTSLETFIPSDSSWWTDRRLAYGEDPKLGRRLPSKEEAQRIADELVEKLGESSEAARLRAVEPIKAAVSTSPDSKRSYRTGLVVDYRYELARLPVFGPGAKLQVSLVGGGEVSEFLVFWRKPRKSRSVKIIHPYQAVERFMQEGGFAQLREGEAEVSIEGVRLGYFAMGPAAFQRFLIPVYDVRARVTTEAHPEDHVMAYVVATDVGSAEAKKSGVRANPEVRKVFTGA